MSGRSSGRQASATREIKSRLNILDIVRRYVELRRGGGNRWVAPCPFHQETKPSFSVNEEEGFFYCFGCQASGDIFDFYSRINGLEFKETLEILAEEAGVVLGNVRPDPEAAAERDFRKTAFRMYESAKNHFCKNLFSPAGEKCRMYLQNRKITSEIIEEFEIGWSLPEWQGLADTLRRAGFSPKQGIEAGLLAANDRGSGYDRFRGRLIFPIKDLAGKVIAFGGRIIQEEDAAKYINSTDSPLYKKGDNLYGLFQARRSISVNKAVLLTEGYMDVLTLHQFGYANACAALGTALTPEQVRRLAGFCSHMELIFDGDGPGRKAALRACEMVLSKGLACKVVLLPEKEDIDSLLHEKGREAFEELRKFAPDGVDFCIRTLSTWAPLEALEWVKTFLAAVEAPELVSRFISRLTQGLDLDEHELRKNLKPASLPISRAKNAGTPVSPDSAKKGTLDREIMKFVVRYPYHLPKLRDAGAALMLTHDWALTLWEKVERCAPAFEPDRVLRELDDKEKEFWGEIRVMQALPKEHEYEELKDICTRVAVLCDEKQAGAAAQALRRTSFGNDYDPELLRAVNEALLQKRTRSSDG